MVVEASDVRTSDLAILEAEKVALRFQETSGLTLAASPIQLSLRILKYGEGAVFQKEPVFQPGGVNPQVCMEFPRDLLSLKSFELECAKGLWSRAVWETCFHDWETRKVPPDQRKFRIPLWILEGMAVLVMEPYRRQEMMSHSMIFAKIQEDYLLTDLFSEMDGITEFSALRQSLAALLCESAFKACSGQRTKFIGAMNWDASWKGQDWLHALGLEKDLEGWWKEIWKAHGGQMPYLRMSFQGSSLMITRLQRVAQSELITEKDRQFFESLALKTSSSIHPWFVPWMMRYRHMENENDTAPSGMSELVREIRERRIQTLDWFAQCEVLHGRFDAKSFLEWELFYGDWLREQAGEAGPVTKWFDAISQ
jgi:hypothetical protein